MFARFLLVLASIVGMDADQLVAQLGSPRFAEREAAGEALRGLGREALGPLQRALESPDPEIRSRAIMLVEQIETKLMLDPTFVRLDFHDQPLTVVIKSLGEEARIPLVLAGDINAAYSARRITLVNSERVAFWAAVERLCREAQVQVVPGAFQPMGLPGQSRAATLQFFPDDAGPAPASIEGPFRVVVSDLTVTRHRAFLPGFVMQGANLHGVGGLAGPPAGGRMLGPNENKVDAGVASEQFGLTLQILAEPRLSLLQNGALRLIEATDEKGQTLLGLKEVTRGQQPQFAGFNAFNVFGGSQLHLPISLSLGESPGKWIKRLRGILPVLVMSRKDNPTVISLADAKGKTIETSGLSIQIHDVKAEGGQSIEMTVRMRKDDSSQASPGLPGTEAAFFRNNPGQAQNQLEILDAQGRAYSQWFPLSQQPTNEGLRVTLRVMPSDGLGPPAQVRVYGISRAETEIAFDLHDIRMP